MLTLYCELVRLSVHSDPGAAAPSSRDAKRLRNAANSGCVVAEAARAELGPEAPAPASFGPEPRRAVEASIGVVRIASSGFAVILRTAPTLEPALARRRPLRTQHAAPPAYTR